MAPPTGIQIYRYIQWLSIDVALGACAGLYFFAHLLDTSLHWLFYILMAMAVWSIYTLDHLLDAKQIKETASTDRHRIHQSYAKILSVTLGVVVIMGLGLGFYLLQISLLSLSVLVLAILILLNLILLKYFFKHLSIFKEFNTALFYTIGIMMVPYLLEMEEGVHRGFWYLGIGYFCIAWMNLILLSLMDAATDRADGFSSIVTVMGDKAVEKLLFWLMILTVTYLLLLFWILFSYYYIYITLLLIICIIHALAILDPSLDHVKTRRTLEATFLIPWVLLLIG
jgi:4-hydroxybenzoate polyprenyltransferase